MTMRLRSAMTFFFGQEDAEAQRFAELNPLRLGVFAVMMIEY